MSYVASAMERLSPELRKLMTGMKGKGAGGARRYPPAFAQQGIWFIHQLEPQSALYNMPVAHRYDEARDTPALWRAIHEIVRRHESLRTVFPMIQGVAVQEVMEDVPTIEQVVDLSDLPPAERDERLQRLLKEKSAEPFGLARGPLFRAVLFKLADQRHVLFAATDSAPDCISERWRRYSGRLECHLIRANHYTITKKSAAKPIARRMGELLLKSESVEVLV